MRASSSWTSPRPRSRPGSRPALPGDRPARESEVGDPHLAPARGNLRGCRSDHGARWPDRGYAGGHGGGARRADRLMVGREISAVFPKEAIEIGGRCSKSRGSRAAAGIRDVTLTVRRGEILGIAGLVGSGRTELRARFGLTPAEADDPAEWNHAPDRHLPTQSPPASRMFPKTAGSMASSWTCRLPPTRAWPAWMPCRGMG